MDYQAARDYRDNLYNNNRSISVEDMDKETTKYLKSNLNIGGATSKYLNNLVRTSDSKAYTDIHGYIQRDALREKGKWTAGAGLTSGYGFGLAGTFKASRMDDAKSLLLDTPMVAGEASLNALGLLTKQQKLAAASGGMVSKLMTATIPLGSAAMIGSGMIDGEDPFTIAQNQLMAVGGFTGLVAGARAGGILAPSAKQGVVRGLGRVAGGVAGAAIGTGLVYGLTESIRDITNAESAIGKQAYQMSTRRYFGDTTQTQATLTARQKALRQVNSSVLNDRGFTLGNEASILKNVSL